MCSVKMAWEREDWAFMLVLPTLRERAPRLRQSSVWWGGEIRRGERERRRGGEKRGRGGGGEGGGGEEGEEEEEDQGIYSEKVDKNILQPKRTEKREEWKKGGRKGEREKGMKPQLTVH